MKARFKNARSGVGLEYVFTFGKHKGISVKEIAQEDPDYLVWCQGKKILQFTMDVWDYVNARKREQEERRERQRQKEWDDRADSDRYGFGFDDLFRGTRERFSQTDRYREGVRDGRKLGYDEGYSRGLVDGRRNAMGQERTIIRSPASQWDHLPAKAKAAAVLGLSGKSTKDTLRAAMKRSMLAYHPDKVAQAGPLIQELAHQMTVRINEACDYLKRSYGL